MTTWIIIAVVGLVAFALGWWMGRQPEQNDLRVEFEIGPITRK
jgi:hypothetical protein